MEDSMLGLLVALAMAAFGGATPDDKTIHSCPNGWEVGANPETGEKGCFPRTDIPGYRQLDTLGLMTDPPGQPTTIQIRMERRVTPGNKGGAPQMGSTSV